MKKLGLRALAAMTAVAIMVIGISVATAQSNGQEEDGVAPSGLTATYNDGEVILTWTPGNNPDYTGQSIRERESGVDPIGWIRSWVPVDAREVNYPAHGLMPGRTYVFQIAGVNGHSDAEQGYSNEAELTVPLSHEFVSQFSSDSGEIVSSHESQAEPTVPDAESYPSGLTAETILALGIQVRLNWIPGTDDYDSQIVLRRRPEVSPFVWDNRGILEASESEFIENIFPGQVFIYRIQAVKANNETVTSNPALNTKPYGSDFRTASRLRSRPTSFQGAPAVWVEWFPAQYPGYTLQTGLVRELGARPPAWVTPGPRLTSIRFSRLIYVFPNLGRDYVFRVSTQREGGNPRVSERLVVSAPPPEEESSSQGGDQN